MKKINKVIHNTQYDDQFFLNILNTQNLTLKHQRQS